MSLTSPTPSKFSARMRPPSNLSALTAPALAARADVVVGELERADLERRGDAHAAAAAGGEPAHGGGELRVAAFDLAELELLSGRLREQRVDARRARLRDRVADDGVAVGHRRVTRTCRSISARL